MKDVASRIDAQRPTLANVDKPDDALIAALSTTTELVKEFNQVTESVAAHDAKEAAVALQEEFHLVLAGYHRRRGGSEAASSVEYDFHKFLGHELFVSLLAPLIREQRWTKDPAEEIRPAKTAWDVLQSAQAILLKERHSAGQMPTSFDEFIDADLFLCLRSLLEPAEPPHFPAWHPESALYLGDRIPRFLADCEHTDYAQKILSPLGLPSIDEFRRRLQERKQSFWKLFSRASYYFPLSGFKPESIGTK